jgi:hypothetical protein
MSWEPSTLKSRASKTTPGSLGPVKFAESAPLETADICSLLSRVRRDPGKINGINRQVATVSVASGYDLRNRLRWMCETPDRPYAMSRILDFPVFVLLFSFVVLWFSALFGGFLRRYTAPLQEEAREDFGVVQAAILTLLGLLIGFTFSMALNRYDQRKNYEEAEANAIGTEYVRVELLSSSDAARAQELLRRYLDQRVLFYTIRDAQQRRQIDSDTVALQNDLWSVVRAAATAQPTPPIALVVSGMNDVLNSQGYTQAAWLYRIPVEAWNLMAFIAIGCNLLIGFGARQTYKLLLLIVPLAVSVSFFLIADIDSPLSGLIHVQPLNLVSLAHSLAVH